MYRYAAPQPRFEFAPATASVSTLDRATLLTLREVAQAVIPADDYLPPGRDDDRELTLALARWIGAESGFDVPLSLPMTDADWNQVRDLVGDVDE